VSDFQFWRKNRIETIQQRKLYAKHAFEQIPSPKEGDHAGIEWHFSRWKELLLAIDYWLDQIETLNRNTLNAIREQMARGARRIDTSDSDLHYEALMVNIQEGLRVLEEEIPSPDLMRLFSGSLIQVFGLKTQYEGLNIHTTVHDFPFDPAARREIAVAKSEFDVMNFAQGVHFTQIETYRADIKQFYSPALNRMFLLAYISEANQLFAHSTEWSAND
jgi:hypothetical protein